jgi:hypothetical protein
MNWLTMSSVKIIFNLFFNCVRNLKFNRAYLHHDNGNGVVKRKKSAIRIRSRRPVGPFV